MARSHLAETIPLATNTSCDGYRGGECETPNCDYRSCESRDCDKGEYYSNKTAFLVQGFEVSMETRSSRRGDGS